jgi:hypothetical protein
MAVTGTQRRVLLGGQQKEVLEVVWQAEMLARGIIEGLSNIGKLERQSQLAVDDQTSMLWLRYTRLTRGVRHRDVLCE